MNEELMDFRCIECGASLGSVQLSLFEEITEASEIKGTCAHGAVGLLESVAQETIFAVPEGGIC